MNVLGCSYFTAVRLTFLVASIYISGVLSLVCSKTISGDGPATPTQTFRARKCPVFEPPAECPGREPEDYCLHDRDCPDVGLKCCDTGCELDCVVPDEDPNTTSQMFRAGKCPVIEPPLECPAEQEDYCLHDRDCPGGLKCCNTGCELDCVIPDEDPNTTSQMPTPTPTQVQTTAQTISGDGPATPTQTFRAGKCPVFELQAECPEEPEDYCLHDRDCPDEGLKCCNTGCELDCVVPDEDPNTTSQMPTPTPTQVQTTAQRKPITKKSTPPTIPTGPPTPSTKPIPTDPPTPGTKPIPTDPPTVHPACKPGSRYDAVVVEKDIRGKDVTHFIQGDYFLTVDERLRTKSEPKKVRDYWPNVRTPVDAAYRNKQGNIVFFSGNRFWEYNNRRQLTNRRGGTLRQYGLSVLLANMDTVFTWNTNKKTYFFKDTKYWRYNENRRSLDAGYPRNIRAGWPDLPRDIDAAVTWLTPEVTSLVEMII